MRPIALLSLALLACGCSDKSDSPDLDPSPRPKAIRDGVIGVSIVNRYTVIPGGNQCALIVEKVDSGSLAEKAGIRDGAAIVSVFRRTSDNTTMWGSVGKARAESIWSFYEFAHSKDSTVSFGFGAYQDNEYREFVFPADALKRLYGPVAVETTKTKESAK